jgi:hypothetical protein
MDVSRDRQRGSARQHQMFWGVFAFLVLAWLVLTVMTLVAAGPFLAGWLLASGAGGALALGVR